MSSLRSSENFSAFFFRPQSNGLNITNREFGRALITISTLILTFACLAWTKNARRRLARLPPGPRGWPLVGYLPFLKPDLHRQFTQLAQTHGPIMSFPIGAKLCVVLSSPDAAKRILKDHDANFANRDPTAAGLILARGGSNISMNTYGSEWRMLRKTATQELMSNARFDAYYKLRRGEVRRMVRDVHRMAGRPINVAETIFQTMLGIVTRMLWGGGTTDDEESRRSSVEVEIREKTEELVDLVTAPNVSDLFPLIGWLDLQGVVKRAKRMTEWWDGFFDSVIGVRRSMGSEGVGEKEKSKDFLQQLLHLIAAEDHRLPLTLFHVKGVLLDLLIGATDTTSTTIEWAMTKLIQHPEIMRKLQEELDEVVGMNDIVEESHLLKLQYLHAVIKETLRLFPIVPFLVPRTPSEPCIVDGYMIPKGSRVMINAWAIHRDPEVWEDPLEFKPERFISASTNGKKFDLNGSDFRYIPFGAGRRVCMGIPMAERTLLYGLASLVHSFEWRLPDGTKLDETEKFGIVLKKASPLTLVPIPRLSNMELYKP